MEVATIKKKRVSEVKPIRGHFICRIKKIDPCSKSGIIFPEGVKTEDLKEVYSEHPIQGIVCWVGDPWNDYPMQVKEGDKVYLRQGKYDSVVINMEYFSICRETDIIAIITETDED